MNQLIIKIAASILMCVGFSTIANGQLPHQPSMADGDTLYIGNEKIVKFNKQSKKEYIPDQVREKTVVSGIWGDEVRLTYQGNTDSTTLLTMSEVNNSGDTLALAYGCQMRSPWTGSREMLISSTNFGQIWSSPYWYNDSSSHGLYIESIYIDESNLYLGGVISPHTGNRYIPFFRKCIALDYDWDEPYYFFDFDEYDVSTCGIGRLADTLYFLYHVGLTQLRGYVDSVFISRSFNDGLSWTPPQPIIHWEAASSHKTFLEISQNVFNLVYQEQRPQSDYAIEAYQAISTDFGYTWETRPISDEDSIPSQGPYLAKGNNGELVTTWFDYKYGAGPWGLSGDILGKVSSDNGLNWGPEFRITNQSLASLSACMIHGNHIMAVWLDLRHGLTAMELHTSESYDGGLSWSDEYNLSTSPNYRYNPTLITNYPKALLFWNDRRFVDTSYQTEVYIMQYEAATSINDNQFPQSYHIGLQIKCFPNPFNENTAITIQSSSSGMADFKIYNMLGQLVYELPRINLVKGRNILIWDGTNSNQEKVHSGIYFINVQERGGSATSTISLIR